MDRAERPLGSNVVMLVANQLVHDGRVRKTAATVARAGYRVTVLGIARQGVEPGRRRLEGYDVWLADPDSYNQAVEEATAERDRRRDRVVKAGLRWEKAFRRRSSIRRGRLLESLRAHRHLRRESLRLEAACRAHREAVAALREARAELKGRPRFFRYEHAWAASLRELRPDLIHVHDYHGLPVAFQIANELRAQGQPVPVIYDAHEYLAGREQAKQLDGKPEIVEMETGLAPGAAAVITVSDTIADIFAERLGRRPTVVYNTPLAAVRPRPMVSLRETIGLGDDVPLVLYSGAVGELRGIDVLVRAVSYLPEAHLALVASEYDRHTAVLLDLAAELGIADRVHVAPMVPVEQVVPYLSGATAGAYTPREDAVSHVAAPNKLFEYLHAGLPLVVSDLGEIGRFVRETGCGETFTPGDAEDCAAVLRLALADPSAYLADRERLIAEWSWEAQEEKILRVYRTLLTPASPELRPGGSTRAGRRAATGDRAVFAGLASVAERMDSLARTVESLLPQVDRIGVYLDGYPDVPACLDDPRIAVVRSRDDVCGRDRRDAGKFYWADLVDGYYVSCDDDIVYPDDYVQTLVAAIERYGREAVVGLHGREYGRPAQAFGGYFANYHCLRDVAGEHPVHLLGTGTLAYHTSTICVSRDDFEHPNMADVWFAKLAQEQRVPLVVLPHRAGWICHTNHARTIASECSAGTGSVLDTGALQERLVESTRWQLNVPAGDADLYPVGRAVVAARRGDHITDVLARGSWYEADLLERLRACGASGVYVDVGAHVGNHTAFFATECAAERIIAIEPDPDSYRRLLATITGSGLQSRAQALRAAVHPTWTSAHVLAGPDTDTGMARVERHGNVPVVRLDETLNGDRVGLIKVDVDGLGVDVLRTASAVIARDRPVLAVGTDEPATISSLLDPHGYRQSERPYAQAPVWVWEPAPDLAADGRA